MKKILTVLIIICVLTVTLCTLSANPIVSCDIDIPQSTLDAVKEQAKGVYSSRLPLVPLYVSVTDYNSNCVYYTINYLPFGTVDMSFSETDGYNIEKQLTRLS